VIKEAWVVCVVAGLKIQSSEDGIANPDQWEFFNFYFASSSPYCEQATGNQ